MKRTRARLYAYAVLAVYLGLAISCVRTNMPWSDEAWFASPALNLITKGYMGTSILDPTATWRTNSYWLTGINQHTYWMPPLYAVVQAGWYKLAGFGLFQMRLLSVLWGLVALIAWYCIVLVLSKDRRVALLTAFLLAVDFQFLWSASVGRMDMMCAALGQAAIAVFLLVRERNFAWAVLLSQTLVVASGLSHPAGLVAFTEVLVVTLYLDRKRLRLAHLLLAAIPYAAGAIGWGWYISKNPHDFALQFSGNASGRFFSVRRPLEFVHLQVVQRYLYSYGFDPVTRGLSHIKIFVLIAFAVGLCLALSVRDIRRHRGYRLLLWIWVTASVTMVIIDRDVHFFYIIHLVEPLIAILAVAIIWCWDRPSSPRWVLTMGLAAFVLVELAVVGSRISQNRYRNSYLQATGFLEKNTSKSDLIIGSAELAFQLGFDSNLVDDFRLGTRSGRNPSFVVIDENRYAEWIALLRDQEPDSYRQITGLLTREFDQVYAERAYQIYVRKDRRAEDSALAR